jgi:hypothetical protein
MHTAEQIQDCIDQELILETDLAPLTVSYSEEFVRSTLRDLCPPATAEDVFSDEHLRIIADSTPLQVTGDDVRYALEHLPEGAAAGASGWTFAAMKAIFVRNSAHAARASDLVAAFCNLMLSGKLGSDIWLRSRSVFIPKKDGRPRPLGIGDAWYRLVGRVSHAKVGKRVGK